ncbi:MAG: alpha/beta fold hydrolase, partial [Propionibacteriaceae bacterium]
MITPDLPSHRTPMAGLIEDAAEVRDAIRACAPPVAAVGWSYGGSVIGVAA